MSNQQEFSNIENESKKKNPNENGLQGIIRILSILPCLPKSEPMPDTPNIDNVYPI